MGYSPRNRTLGEYIYDEIDQNEYLNKLYNKLIRDYSRKIFRRELEPFFEKEISDLLRFADLLSKSTNPKKKGTHKIWAQQIVALLDKLFPNNDLIKIYKFSVLSVCNNYQGLKSDKKILEDSNILEQAVINADKLYFKVPNHPNDYFFEDQKGIYDSMSKGHLSYSAPTSQGKSYIMKVFIREQILKGCYDNFAIVVPTKALINETRHKMLEELKENNITTQFNYRIVTSTGDIALEQKHHFIFIMTPERFLYLLNTTAFLASYVFIDEAHKISSKDKRSAFYYQLVSKLMKSSPKPTIVFASPNIPNPEEYLKLINGQERTNKFHSEYAPVSQIKQLIDCSSGRIEVYNDFSKKFIKMGNDSPKSLNEVIKYIGKSEQNLVYCNSLRETIDQAVDYAKTMPSLDDKVLKKLSKDIRNEINNEYYLADLIEKGVAYHVGYLPASIRLRIEDAYKQGLIKTLFCTSTLIEGVNLPADNLFITSHKSGLKNLDEVTFRNLIGRVGRIDHSLFGNVFLINILPDNQQIEHYKKLLIKDIPNQKLSIETTLSTPQKKAVVESLLNKDFEMANKPPNTTNDEFEFMRKVATTIITNLKTNTEDAIMHSFSKELTNEAKQLISEKYQDTTLSKGINITPDQTTTLKEYIQKGASYPPKTIDNKFDWTITLNFLIELAHIFKWNVYERQTIGKINDCGEYSALQYFTGLLTRWMSGNGLFLIVKSAIDYKKDKPSLGIWVNGHCVSDHFDFNNKRHINYVIAETLSNIENVILFSFANYFREFSTEYKQFHNVDHFDNDWYEYVEYGTTDPFTIILQRNGYTRETARYIIEHRDKFINTKVSTQTAPFVLALKSLSNCDNENVKMETIDVAINVPELFE